MSTQTTGKDWEDLTPSSGEPGESEGRLLGDYRVELPVFEGPLDLLLHLIRKHEVDIFDIPVALITDKYLAYLEWMRVLDIDIASEFLVMASTLAHIKSRMLLPEEELEEGVGEEEIDPRDELVRRLLDYQRYKEAGEDLRDRPILYRDVFVRGTRTPANGPDSPYLGVSVFKLVEAFDRVLKRADKKISYKVMMEHVSIADRIHELAELLRDKPEVVFDELFVEARTRSMVVVTFLALLEMARLRMVRLHQAQDSDVIHVRGLLADEDLESVLSSLELQE